MYGTELQTTQSGDGMKRRELLALLGGAAAWPLAAYAQPAAVATIGVLVTGNPDPGPFLQGLREGLRAAGHVEGQMRPDDAQCDALGGELAMHLVQHAGSGEIYIGRGGKIADHQADVGRGG